MAANSYLERDRLEDVLFLIQYLGLRDSYALEERTKTEGVYPRSVMGPDKLWVTVAREHPEFFRVTSENSVMLWMRFFQPQKERPPLTVELVQKLMEQAMALHERQTREQERRNALDATVQQHKNTMMTLWVALIAGGFTLIATMLPRWLGH